MGQLIRSVHGGQRWLLTSVNTSLFVTRTFLFLPLGETRVTDISSDGDVVISDCEITGRVGDDRSQGQSRGENGESREVHRALVEVGVGVVM